MDLIKLNFTSPLHLSKGKSGLDDSYDVLHSDTLKSALFVCALQLYGDEITKVSFLEAFTISSGFPFSGDELFFPKPFLLPDTFFAKDAKADIKLAKAIKYVSKPLFEQLLQGNFKPFLKENISHSTFLSHKKLVKKPFENEVAQHVTVSRTYENEGDTFYTDRVFFNQNCGLFCLLKVDNQELKEKIIAAFKLLGDNGIGSDKSVGNGQFEATWHPFEMQKVENATHQIALSLFLPKEHELKSTDFNHCGYELIKRGGYIANPENFNNSTLRKKSIYMFKEGSTFPQGTDFEGDVKDLNPKNRPLTHEIFRDGRALFIGYNIS